MITTAHFSDAGPRSRNEDRVIDVSHGEIRIIGVADGLGGHLGGAEAAEIVVEVATKFNEPFALAPTNLLEDAHRKILSAQSQSDELRGMGTTATIAVIEGYLLKGAHVGDTRCLIQRDEGIIRLTKEHTEAFRLFEAGKLTKEEYLHYPRRNILDNALGSKKTPYIDTFSFNLEIGDKLAIFSDGVHEKIKLRELLPILRNSENADFIVTEIIKEMKKRGPEDNFSGIVAIVS